MSVLANLPESTLKRILLEKLESQQDYYHAFCNHLSSFRERVVPELKQINVLYCEFTPHDEDNHISNLFKISDMIIGEEQYRRMNVVELGLLIGGIYAHDWGMAVSSAERYYIATKKLQEGSAEMPLLADEFERFEQFIKKRLGKTEFESDKDIDDEIWREYVRNTHALRSGKRAKEYFKEFDGSVAEALSKICIGHWLEIEDVSDRNGYYRDEPVFGETVNLKALTIYIRLVDMFDLGENRTPYALWKYVNPQNVYSKMEWEKHRALHQITCPKFEDRRIICISGRTDNHEVYAALMDFKKLCERYFREDIDALAHMSDPRHKLDVYLLDWRIEPQHFKPIEIGFSFDRENVFKILSDEIYNCHPYVFVRELIQNSIDAINLRREILERKGIGGGNLGLITFEIEKKSEEEIEVTCIDDGIGMDEYILKNYFSVLGKSYYTSADYNSLGTNMTAISKFGVGILSCFSVADSMKIYTRREPYIEEGKQGLKVLINDLRKTFRVEEIPDHKCAVGTKISLTIKTGALAKQLKKNNLSGEYSITNYLEKINKYIEYPIVVKENDKKKIFVPKNYDEQKLKSKIQDYAEYEIQKVDIQYPVENYILPQDLEFFEAYFRIRDIDIKEDLGIDKFEGNLLFPVLKNDQVKIQGAHTDYTTTGILVDNKVRIRWLDAHARNNVFICNKGILLENTELASYYFDFNNRLFPDSLVCINFPNTIDNISLSRFDYNNSEMIMNEVREKLHLYISNELIQKKADLQQYEYWRMVALYVIQYRLNVEKLPASVFENVEYPFVNQNGELEYINIKDKAVIKILPTPVRRISDEYGITGFFIKEESWDYGECLLSAYERYYTNYSIDRTINMVVYKSLLHNFYLKELTFVKNKEHDCYLPQEVWVKGKEDNSSIKKVEAILKEFDDQYDMPTQELMHLFIYTCDLKKCDEFADGFSQYFAYGFQLLNLKHPYTHMLIKYVWCVEQLRKNTSIDKILLERNRDRLKEIPFFTTGYLMNENELSFSKTNQMLKELHDWLRGYYPRLGDEYINLTEAVFIEGTIKCEREDIYTEEKVYDL